MVPPVSPRRVRQRAQVFSFVALMALGALAFAYLPVQGVPFRPLSVDDSPTRGRILTRDGTVLALTVGGRRRYPQGTLAGPLLGLMGRDAGLEGLERAFETRLAAGQDVMLTLDPGFQAVAEGVLGAYARRSGAKTGSVVALERGTGRILALASYPPFDPNPRAWRVQGGQAVPIYPENFTLPRNRALQDAFEPGSVVKALTVATLLNERATDLQRSYPTPMRRRIGNHTINDVVPRPAGVTRLNLEGILRYSSNVGISHLVENYPAERLYQSFARLGWGQALDLGGLPNAPGTLRPWREWGELGKVTGAFGQGLTVSTLQLAAAYNTLASEGLYQPPRLLEDAPSGAVRRVFDHLPSEVARGVMQRAFEAGVGTRLGVPGYAVSGKSGTAQVAVGGRYSATLYTSVFAGFVPAGHPQVSLVVSVYGAPQNYQGSQLAGPVFSEVASEMLARWGQMPQSAAPSGAK